MILIIMTHNNAFIMLDRLDVLFKSIVHEKIKNVTIFFIFVYYFNLSKSHGISRSWIMRHQTPLGAHLGDILIAESK